VEKSNLISTPFSRTKDVNPPQKHSPQKNKGPINIFLALLLMLFIIACVPQTTISPDVAADKEKAKQEVKQQKNPYANAEITIKTIPAANNTFGYDILLYMENRWCISPIFRDYRGWRVSAPRKERKKLPNLWCKRSDETKCRLRLRSRI
jgi:hypothetical protein